MVAAPVNVSQKKKAPVYATKNVTEQIVSWLGSVPVRGDIHSHVPMLSVDMKLREEFNALLLSLWQIDSYLFSLISPKIKQKTK